jgi:dTDP-4-amino-4,6-dideoxygalactose transaminase
VAITAEEVMISYKRYLNPDFITAEPNNQLKKIFQNKNLLWTSSGRGSIEAIIKMLNLKPGDKILLPPFIAHGVILPLKRNKISLEFYKSNDDLTFDLKDIAKLIAEKSSVKAILIIHYFGYPQPIDTLKNYINNKKIFIIEDCAQAFLSCYEDGSMIGTKGDVSLFSLSKSLPIPDGSFVIINNPSILMEQIKYKFSVLSKSALINHYIYLKIKYLQSNLSNRFIYYLMNFISKFPYLLYYISLCWQKNPTKISNISKEILQKFDFVKFKEKRISNYYELIKECSLSNYTFPRFISQKPYVLIGIPFLSGNKIKVISQLKKNGYEVLNYNKLWNFIPKSKLAHFHNELLFYENHLLLPVNENIEKESIKELLTKTIELICDENSD